MTTARARKKTEPGTAELARGDAGEAAARVRSLSSMQHACQACRACPLYQHATQAVVGEGPRTASLMLVGEQPGDEEDRAGHPFVGPAGRLLDKLLGEAGIDRQQTFVTNAVKHFKFVERGKRRLHEKPRSSEVKACAPWLGREIALVQPRVVVALGATAAQSLLGSAFRLTAERGHLVEKTIGTRKLAVLATYHPAALLRAPTPELRRQQREFVLRDLASAAKGAK